MTSLGLVIKGLMAGLAISAPVGPVNVLCAGRTLSRGRNSGLISGLGAATADALYGSIAAFSITFIIAFLEREEFWIRVFGGLLLIGIGILYIRKPPAELGKETNDKSGHSDYISTLLLTLTNPTTVLSFLALLTGLGMGGHKVWWLTFLVVGGIFTGSMLWWVILVMIVDHLRDRFSPQAFCWMNRIAGFAIGAFGLVTLLLGLHHGR